MSSSIEMRPVRTGLTMVLSALAITIGGTIGIAVAPYLVTDAVSFVTVQQILIYLVLGASVLNLLGEIACLKAPRGLEDSPLLMAAILLDGLAVVTAVVAQVIALPAIVLLARLVIATIAFTLFVMFLRQLAQSLNRKDLAKVSILVLVAGGLYLGIAIVAIGLKTTLITMPTLAVVLTYSMTITSLVFVVFFIGLLTRLRLAV